jgi:signal transduction histidine kinase
MNDQDNTKEDLIIRLNELRQENNALKASYEKDIIERKAAEEEAQRHSKELATLFRISQEFATTLDLAKILQLIADRVTDLTDLKSSAIYLAEGETLRLWATTPPLPPQFPEELRIAPLAEHPHIRKVLNTGQSIFVFDTANADFTAAERAVCELRSLRSILYLPLFVGTQALGVLIVTTSNEPQRLSSEEQNLFNTFANLAAMAVGNAHLYETQKGYARELENRVAALKQAEEELVNSKEKAEESDRLKSAFLANMSHEIRTPMNGILGFADLLKEPDLSGEQQQKYIRIIEKSGNRMLNIINDIIDISKIEAGLMNLEITESNINEQTEYIYTFFKPEIEAKGISLSNKNTLPGVEAIIKTDREKLFAILTNLVKNAIKYTYKGLIEFGYVKKGEFLEFFVKDTGIGIQEDRQEAIFERFIQVDISKKQAYQGAGLGLSISKAYVEMLGGTIWVDSGEGVGSTFYFTIPYQVESKKNPVVQQTSAMEEVKTQIRKQKM